MRRSTYVAGALMGVTLAAISPAHAQTLKVEALAQMNNMRFEVYDLDPSDGVAASVAFVDDSKRWRLLTDGNYAYGGSGGDWTYNQGVSWTSAFGGASQASPGSGVNVSAGGIVTGVALWARARGFDINVASQGYAGVSSTGDTTSDGTLYFYNMLLGAGTGLRLTADASVSVRVEEQCLEQCAYADANADLFATFSSIGSDGRYGTVNRRTVSQTLGRYVEASTNSPTFTNAAATQAMSLTFENRLHETMVGRVRYSVDANAEGAFTSAVPEPATWLLSLFGLAAVVASTRRRPTSM